MKIKLVNLSIPEQNVHIDAQKDTYTTDEIKSVVGKIASICYTDKSYDEFIGEDDETSIKRANGLLKNGHHSPFDQVFAKLYISEATKITLMAFNGGRFYAAEEGSDRYRPMKLSRNEQQDFDNLTNLYMEKITEITPNPSKYVSRRTEKLALENARYCMPTDIHYKDIFYTASIRELNYMYNWAKDFDATQYPKVTQNMISDLKDFTDFMETSGLVMPGLKDHFDRGFAFFKNQPARPDEYGYNYCMSYQCSIACAGQMERHKFLNCHFSLSDDTANLEFYMPPMIKDDIQKRAEVEAIYQKYSQRYPQGTLGTFTECGNVQDFLRMYFERGCAYAQFEINQVAQSNLKKYIRGLENTNGILETGASVIGFIPVKEYYENQAKANKTYIEILSKYEGKQVCKANGGKCPKESPCGWEEGRDLTLRRY